MANLVDERLTKYAEYKQAVRHPQDCFWTITMVEPITTPISWFISQYTSIPPTAITLLRILFLFPVSALLFLFLKPEYYLLGALAYYLAFISDNIDGHVARATGKTSKTGAILDEVSDRMYIVPIISMYIAYYAKMPVMTIIGVILLYTRLFRKIMDLHYVERFAKPEDAKASENVFLKLDKKIAPILQRINPRIEGIFVRFHFAQLTVLFFAPIAYAITGAKEIITVTLILFFIGQITLDLKHTARILNSLKGDDTK